MKNDISIAMQNFYSTLSKFHETTGGTKVLFGVYTKSFSKIIFYLLSGETMKECTMMVHSFIVSPNNE